MNRSLNGFATLGVAALLLAGCAGGPSDAPVAGDSSGGAALSGDPIEVLVLFGETGGNAAYAGVFYAGIDSAVETVNAAGGVAGRPINVSYVDNGSDPATTVSLLTEALNSASPPDVVFPGSTSNEALAALPLTTSKEVLSISTAASPRVNAPAEYPYHFGLSAPQQDGLSVLVDEFSSQGYESIAVLTSSDAFGDSLLTGITAVADEAGVEVTTVERPAGDALDYTVEMQRLVAGKPDAIFFDLITPASSALVLSARDIVGASDIPIYGGTAAAATPIANLVDASAVQNCSLPVYTFTVKGEGGDYLAPFFTAFESESDGSLYFGGEGWDFIQVIATAFAGAASDSAAGLTAELEGKGVGPEQLALFPAGTTYSPTNHFSSVTEGSLTLVPCSSTVEDGFWVE